MPFVTMTYNIPLRTAMPPASKVSVQSFVSQCNGEMIPLNKSLSYFSAMPLEEDELRKLLYEPVAAIPPKVADVLPNLRIVLVPYLEKGETPGPANENSDGVRARKKPKEGKRTQPVVAFNPPPDNRRLWSATSDVQGKTFLFLAAKAGDLASYHFAFYNGLASLISEHLDNESRTKFQSLVREELASETHGEIDEKSWRLKERILQRRMDPKGDSKFLQQYFRQAMEDTLTLYLHGLCCDIDVEAGPRQLASRYVRRRLVLLREVLPPPAGFALFPEEL